MRKNAFQKVHAKLAAAYGPLPRIARERPLDSLIGTILSQNTTDVNSGRAYASLRRAFPRWEQVEQAGAADIVRAIRQGGLAEVKSTVIKRALQTIRQREGRLSLARLDTMKDEEAMEYLLSLPGVGVKTAACVLLFSLGRPVFPVDTHVYRTTRRLGWLPDSVKVDDATDYLERSIPPELRFGLHLYLVWHGRRACRPRNPRCSACPIARHCRAYRTQRLPR